MKRFILGSLAALFLSTTAGADPFKFVYHTGDQYRYYGSSTQKISINGQFAQDSFLAYKIAYSVVGVDDSGGGQLRGHITYLTQFDTTRASAIAQEYDVDYRVDARGVFTVPSGQVMPVVRNVPTFPDRELKKGDTWKGQGEEVHDLSQSWGVDQLLHVPFEVDYVDLGPTTYDGKAVTAIQSEYNLYKRTGFRFPSLAKYPILMTGYSRQIHYFNEAKGREEGYEEEYSLVLTLNNGQVYEFSGRGESHLVEAKTMDKPSLVQEVKKGLEDRGLANVEVKSTPQGVVLNLDNILFPGESAVLVASEIEKLRLIGQVLKQYGERDILVEGHTADVYSASDPQKLSEARAAAVGNYLVSSGVRRSEQIVYRGWGSTRPVAPNDTEAGRAKNRRVEITLLEN